MSSIGGMGSMGGGPGGNGPEDKNDSHDRVEKIVKRMNNTLDGRKTQDTLNDAMKDLYEIAGIVEGSTIDDPFRPDLEEFLKQSAETIRDWAHNNRVAPSDNQKRDLGDFIGDE